MSDHVGDENEDDDLENPSENRPSGQNIGNSGDGNFNFVGRDINGDVHFQSPKPFVQTLDVRRAWQIPLYVRPQVLSVVGALSFLLTMVGTIASLLSLLAPTSYPPVLVGFGHLFSKLGPWVVFVLLPFGAVAFLCGLQLWRSRFANVGLVALERDTRGSTWLTRLTGPCPRCDGKLNMHGGSPGTLPGCYLTCSENPDHSWRFDFTSLNPINA